MGDLILAAFFIGLFFTIGRGTGLYLGKVWRNCVKQILIPKLERYVGKTNDRQITHDEEEPNKLRMGFEWQD